MTIVRLDACRARLSALGSSSRALLPKGDSLPEQTWTIRHRGICALLFAHVAVLPLVGVLRDQTLAHAGFEAATVAGFAAAAMYTVKRNGKGSHSIFPSTTAYS